MKPLPALIHLTAIVATAATLGSLPAKADDPQRLSIEVPRADLNLSTHVGQDRLQTRIEAALATICGSRGHLTYTASRARQVAARRQCLASVVALPAEDQDVQNVLAKAKR